MTEHPFRCGETKEAVMEDKMMIESVPDRPVRRVTLLGVGSLGHLALVCREGR
jgi:hypothetical protein